MSRSKKPKREGASPLGQSQRQLRVGELVRHAPTAGFVTFLSSPAIAEVCDKVAGESWRPQDGAVWMFNPGGFPLELLVLFGGLLLVWITGISWLGYFGSALVISYAALIASSDLLSEHDVYQAAVQEGCRSSSGEFLEISGLIIFALAFAGLGYRARRPNAQTN